MDLRETTQPVLHPLVEQLLADERLAAFAEALPAPARLSEPALPLVLAALHEQLGRALVCAFPEDADARDAAEAARWFLGEERVALLPSRGVGWGSGLEPPPHLVGERARALDVLERGGLVCASAIALAEPTAPSTSCNARCVNGENARTASISSPKSSTRSGSRPVVGKTSIRPPRTANSPRSCTRSTRV